ncbi:MAG: hypothetical protein R3B58_01700 [Phycisphaerales bacterium]|nr:isoprenylcysteine carboxylmethyltransferase family protein [Phycisphaerales bacterium]
MHAPTNVSVAHTPKEAGSCPIHALIQWRATGSMLSRISILIFGLVSYFVFFGTILYTIGFVSDAVVPKTINSGTAGPWLPSLLINSAMLLLFVVQHTIMARPWFKRWFIRYVPCAMERSTFVLFASVILLAMCWLWQPVPSVVWSVSNPILANMLFGLSMFGWVLVFASTFMLSHFDLFGVRQVVTNAMGNDYRPIPFRLVWMYKVVRHPLMLGFIIAIWPTPTMTVGHLFFAVMVTGYIFFGVMMEERDLVAAFGDSYRQYRKEVRGLLPLPKFGRKEGAA